MCVWTECMLLDEIRVKIELSLILRHFATWYSTLQ